MKDEEAATPAALSDEPTVTRRRALGLAVAAAGVTMLVRGTAHADDDTLGEDEDEQDIPGDDSESDGDEDEDEDDSDD